MAGEEPEPQPLTVRSMISHLLIAVFDPASLQHRLRHRLAECNLSVAMLLSGLFLLWGETFTLAPYELVRQTGPQWMWGAGMTIVGVSRVAALIINGAIPRGKPHARWLLASISAMIWCYLLVGFLVFGLAHGTPVLIAAFLLPAVMTDLVVAYRAAQDARDEDDKALGQANGKPG